MMMNEEIRVNKIDTKIAVGGIIHPLAKELLSMQEGIVLIVGEKSTASNHLEARIRFKL